MCGVLCLDDGNIYYQVIRNIQIYEELLVYYGDGYASCLDIDTTQPFENVEIVKKSIKT